jgi:hypothetical protein
MGVTGVHTGSASGSRVAAPPSRPRPSNPSNKRRRRCVGPDLTHQKHFPLLKARRGVRKYRDFTPPGPCPRGVRVQESVLCMYGSW